MKKNSIKHVAPIIAKWASYLGGVKYDILTGIGDRDEVHTIYVTTDTSGDKIDLTYSFRRKKWEYQNKIAPSLIALAYHGTNDLLKKLNK